MQTRVNENLAPYELFDSLEELKFLAPLARDWQMDWKSIHGYLKSPQALKKRAVAEAYLKIAPQIVQEVEAAFQQKLLGTLVWMPSFGDFDGFARYELGSHMVLLGIDYPDADVDYLKALTAHELSHVYRDHSPRVWEHLGKPLSEVTRRDYLNASTAAEHLVSEGLATLFSMTLYPEIGPEVHHYYEPYEWKWCEANDEDIAHAIHHSLSTDQDVWSFYSPHRVKRGSPSRVQYYYAAKVLAKRLSGTKAQKIEQLIKLHQMPFHEFEEFSR